MMASAALTPGAFCAAARSIDTTRACACGDRRIRAYSIPGRLMSYVYFARPDTFSGPSTRVRRFPRTADSSGAGHGYFACCFGRAGALTSGTWSATGHSLLRVEHGLEHARVRAAPADVAVERGPGLVGRRVGVLLEQRDRRHHEPRRAEAAH